MSKTAWIIGGIVVAGGAAWFIAKGKKNRKPANQNLNLLLTTPEYSGGQDKQVEDEKSGGFTMSVGTIKNRRAGWNQYR